MGELKGRVAMDPVVTKVDALMSAEGGSSSPIMVVSSSPGWKQGKKQNINSGNTRAKKGKKASQ